MRALSAARALHLPVRLHGIQLGRSADLLVDPAAWRAVGFDVLCGDDASRFLPFTTARIHDDEIRVDSALMLLEDIEFYRTRASGLRALVGSEIEVGGVRTGTLRDLELEVDGAVAELLVENDGAELRIAAGAGLTVVTSRRDAA